MTGKDYREMSKRASDPTKSLHTVPCAFAVGGLICTLGQALMQLYRSAGVPEDAVPACVSVTLIALSALLTGLHCYDKLARYAGAGTLVPITGFANAIVSSALEFKAEGYIMGLGAKMFAIAGPVIVYGISASAVYGVVYWASTLL